MSVTENGQVLGAATVLGAWTTLPYTKGTGLAYNLNLLVLGTGGLVVASFILSRIVLMLKEKQ